MHSTTTARTWMTVTEAARYMRMSTERASQLVADHKIRAYKPASFVLLNIDEIDAYIRSKEVR